MNKTFLVIVSAVLVLAVVSGAIFIFFLLHPRSPLPVNTVSPKKKIEVKAPPTPAQQLAQIQKEYPEIVQGVINFLDTKSSLKTTIKTADGKEYILWPPQPKAVYQSFGAKNGQKVEVRAKSLNNSRLEWSLMKPI